LRANLGVSGQGLGHQWRQGPLVGQGLAPCMGDKTTKYSKRDNQKNI